MHELQPAGVTHLHNDTVPEFGGDTLWASGYSAYDKLSPDFRKIIDGKLGVFRSAHPYIDRDDPKAGPKFVERIHPIVRVHPVTGWKVMMLYYLHNLSVLYILMFFAELVREQSYDCSYRRLGQAGVR